MKRRAAHPGAAWTAEAEQHLRDAHRAGSSLQQLASNLGRSANSIRWKLQGLKLTPYPADLVPIQPTETAPKLPKASTVEEKRKAHPNAYTPWTDQDEKDLAARCGFIDATIGDRYVKHVAEEHQLAQVYLQAAVAQAALGEVDEAEHRLGAILALPLEDLLAMARTVAAYVDSVTMVTGSEFATGRPAESGETESLDERVPPDRALTLRLMSAWSSNDVTSFDALFTAAASDSIGALHARDLFVFALEVTEYRAVPAANPQAMVKALCKAMTKHGPSHFSWDLPQR